MSATVRDELGVHTRWSLRYWLTKLRALIEDMPW